MLDTIFAIDPREPGSELRPDIGGEERREECLARAGIYRVLAGAFVEEPSERFLDALRDETLLVELAEAGVHFDTDFLAGDVAQLAEALACEYTTLFAGSGGFPPIESVRLTGRYKQEPHFQVAQTYRRLGFEVGKGRFEVFADQLGVELMFVAALLERSAGALGRDDTAEFRRLEKEIKRFWTLHLGRWVRGYCRLIERAASHSFYREMARFLGGFAEEEIAAMGLKNIEDLDQGRAVVPKSEIKVEFNPDEPVCGACPSGRAEGAATVHPLHDLRL